MKLHAPAGTNTLSIRGITIDVAEDGSVDVDVEIAHELLAFGFKDYPQRDAKPMTNAEKKAKAKAEAELAAAIQVSYDAQAAMLAVEGKGDEKAVIDAKAVLADAEAAVVALQAA
jgi:hypothetical protein